MKTEAIFFKSTRFFVEPGEDQETNPWCYGKQLADWMKDRLSERGWSPVEVIAEDWGRCLMIHYKPYMLWVACSNVRPDVEVSPEFLDENHIPEATDVIWSTFAGRDLHPWNNNFWRRSNADEEMGRLQSDLVSILNAETTITLVAP